MSRWKKEEPPAPRVSPTFEEKYADDKRDLEYRLALIRIRLSNLERAIKGDKWTPAN